MQHFEPIDFSGNSTLIELEKQFKYVKRNDKIKNKYCKDNINLLRISYKENIIDKLKSINTYIG